MRNWTASDVLAIAPEFGGLSVSDIDTWADMADVRLNGSVALAPRRILGIFLTAHYLATFDMAKQKLQASQTVSASPGVIGSKSVGGVSVSYDNSVAGQMVARGGEGMGLASTKYGAEYLRMLRSMGFGVAVI